MKTISILLLFSIVAITLGKATTDFLLVEIEYEEGKGMLILFCYTRFHYFIQQNGCDIHQPVFELLLDIVNHYYNNIGLVQQLHINLRPLLQIEHCK